jgi:pimeloyl-ACP methyl ester carboxylesterase
MGATSKSKKLLGVTLPTLAVAGGVGALGYLRNRFQRRKLFLPDRYPNGVWDPAPFGLDVEDRWFFAGDDVELHGWWIPRRRARGTVLYCHGSSGSIAHQVGVLAAFRRLRANLFAFDYRGYGRSSGEPSEAGLFLDARAAWDHLVETLGVRPEEILLFGHSLGGAVAIDCALERSAAGLVVESSFTQVRDMARASYPGLPLHLVARNQFRSIDKVGRLSLPKLFIHGGSDERVPAALGRRLYEAAAEPKELYVVPGAGHNDVHRHGGVLYLRRISRFRNRCLRAAARAEPSLV